MRMRKADSTLRSSRAVPHPSTNRALRRLTSEVIRDPVHSTRYGRQRNYLRALREPTRLSRRDDSQELFRPAFISHAILAEEGMPQLQKDAQNICCLCIRIVLYRFRFEGRCRLVPMMDCQRLKLIGRKEKAQPAIAQLVKHLTVERCRNPMVPGSIPGGRIFDMQHLYRIIQSPTTEIQPEIMYGLLGPASESKRAWELKSKPKAHCLGGVGACRTCSLDFVHRTLKKHKCGLCTYWKTVNQNAPWEARTPNLEVNSLTL